MKKAISILSTISSFVYAVAFIMELIHVKELMKYSIKDALPLFLWVIPFFAVVHFVTSDNQEKKKSQAYYAVLFYLILAIIFSIFRNYIVPSNVMISYGKNTVLTIINYIIVGLIGIAILYLENFVLCIVACSMAVIKNIAVIIWAFNVYGTLPSDFYLFSSAYCILEVALILYAIYNSSKSKKDLDYYLDDENGYSCRNYLETYAMWNLLRNEDGLLYLKFYDSIRDFDYNDILLYSLNEKEFVYKMASELTEENKLLVRLEDCSDKTVAFLNCLYEIKNDRDHMEKTTFKLIKIIQFNHY